MAEALNRLGEFACSWVLRDLFATMSIAGVGSVNRTRAIPSAD